jgi:glucokinase
MMKPNTLGIDLGGTKMAAAIVDATGTILAAETVARPASGTGMLTEPVALAQRLVDDSVGAIGVGAAGLVDHAAGTLVWGPNVAGEHVEFRRLFQDGLQLPTVLDNDANVAALAEARIGAAQGYRHVSMITLGTGIGGGWMVNGELYRGRSFAGEIGHVVIDAGGPRCTCGQSGCWETFASGRRLDQMARDLVAKNPDGLVARIASGASPDGRDLTEGAIQGDADAIELIEEMAAWLGIGIANLIAAFDPEILVIGGGVCRAGEVLLRPTREAMVEALEGAKHRDPTPIVAAALAEDAGVIGAALLAQETFGPGAPIDGSG